MSKEEFEELAGVKRRIGKVVRATYGRSTAFEHGAASFSKNAGCCIDHAHLHIVPTIALKICFLDQAAVVARPNSLQ
jgi:diadenosine tetraphosphate (Ap4A) HIT family hydrolase